MEIDPTILLLLGLLILILGVFAFSSIGESGGVKNIGYSNVAPSSYGGGCGR